MRFVYIIRCNDATLYTGITNDLKKRVHDHNHSKVGAKYTKARRPVALVWYKKVKNRVIAAKLEFKTKRIGKAKKEELVWSQKNKKNLL
ncbi:MAG: GIY-YIG nuclease family protein [candidate division SR1 bacterium]|nr:GIY-YIG nuclease family protein [candidate division SR1 bacterium]